MISVALATYNEEDNIERCLESVKWADEIVVVDGRSSDDTVYLAKKHGARVISTTNKLVFHINKQMAINACKGDWVFQIDADEVVTPRLATEIKRVVKSKEYNGYWIKRKNFFLGRFLTKGGQYPDKVLRLYRRGIARFDYKELHEQIKVLGATGNLESDLEHYGDITFFRYLTRHNRYTTYMAGEINTNTESWFKYFVVKPIFWFLSTYFRHRGYVDGFPGFVFSLFSSLRFPIAYIKAWELKVTNGVTSFNNPWR